MTSDNNNKKNDVFANIAMGEMDFNRENLIEPKPLVLEERYFNTEKIDQKAVFLPQSKMNTSEQLAEELINRRKEYASYMDNHAPKLEIFRSEQIIKEFDWRIGTSEDERNFAEVLEGKGTWEKVQIPHYGGPLGLAVTYYRTKFQVTMGQMEGNALFICFKGVDYKAHVFINGSYIGSHEGFFAPFEFDFTQYAVEGENTLIVKVENDFIFGGNISEKNKKSYSGDKIYAATGPGYDDPQIGWHHCPPGMGIYQEVYIEERPRLHIKDLFIRPMEDLKSAQAWVEVLNCDIEPVSAKLKISIYGRNFTDTVFENHEFIPVTGREVGMGDSFTEAYSKGHKKYIPLSMEKGTNRLIIPFEIPEARIWRLEEPWLYQANIELIVNEKVVDTFSRHFGMRSFKMDTHADIKGAMFLNGVQIRLRGANTMGHEQQCVMKGDFDQLRDDLLLAKICNMNFLRITQRPIQQEVYDYCDMLGLMLQTDLPLFGVMGRSKFSEGVKQAEEMERLIRNHPSCIMVTYINEPFPNANNKPQRFLTRQELTEFFKAADIVVKLNNPDRVIKHVDGDYDPPSKALPDNHCYSCWYNGHGIDIGKLNKGYWLSVKPDWYYGCGEFGAEGLDPVGVMRKYYPAQWLPQSREEEKEWTPNNIVGAQTGRFHYFFYETPDNLEDWVKASLKHQAWATKIMTEAFRIDNRMTTFAIHLFIDAFPSGWMKTIMDVERRPKPAYFTYRDALEPLKTIIRSDRYKFFAGEDIKLEAWICNDMSYAPESTTLNMYAEMDGKVLAASEEIAYIPVCSSKFQRFISFKAPKVKERTEIIVRLGLMDATGKILNEAEMTVEVFPEIKQTESKKVWVMGHNGGIAAELAGELGLDISDGYSDEEIDLILVDDWESFKKNDNRIRELVNRGTGIVFLELEPGNYDIFDSSIKVKKCSMSPLHFVSRNTGHELVDGFKPDDFRLWYNPEADYITPLLEATFTGEGFQPVLTSGNLDDNEEWRPALAVGEGKFGNGFVRVCQVKLQGRTTTNPVARIFASRLIK